MSDFTCPDKSVLHGAALFVVFVFLDVFSAYLLTPLSDEKGAKFIKIIIKAFAAIVYKFVIQATTRGRSRNSVFLCARCTSSLIVLYALDLTDRLKLAF